MNDNEFQSDNLLGEDGQLLPDRIEDLLVEVISGKYIFEIQHSGMNILASRTPTIAEQEQGRIIYVQHLRVAKTKNLLTKAQILEKALISLTDRKEKESLIAMVDRNMTARSQSTDHNHKIQLANDITTLQRRINEIEVHEDSVLRHSAEAKAGEARTHFYVSRCTLAGEALDTPVWNTYQDYRECVDSRLLDESQRAFMRVSLGLPITIIRALARTVEWRVMWKATKESNSSPFAGLVTSWTPNQRNLVYWSDFYDAIFQHPEAPSNETISNDEMLQDWMTQQTKRVRDSKGKQQGRGSSPTYLDGKGQRKTMTKIGGKSMTVGQPYKVRGSQ